MSLLGEIGGWAALVDGVILMGLVFWFASGEIKGASKISELETKSE